MTNFVWGKSLFLAGNMRKYFILCILFAVSHIGGQGRSHQSEEFKINNDNMPSTFFQSDAKLFDFGKDGFINTWKDARDGEVSTYAQRFDSSGNSINSNFKILSDDGIYFNDDQYLFVKNIGYYDLFIEGFISSDDFSSGKPFIVGYLNMGCVIMGNPSPIFTVCNTSSSYIFGLCLNGEVIINTFDLLGNKLSDIPNENWWGTVNLTSAVTNNNYMFLYFISDVIYNDGGVYATFYNDSNQVVSDKVLLKSYEDLPDLQTDFGPTLLARPLTGLEYQTIIFDEDSLKFFIDQFNTLGQKTKETEAITLQSLPDSGLIIYNFTRSNLPQNQFEIILTLSDRTESNFYSWRLLFDASGEVNKIKTVPYKLRKLGDEIKYISNNNYYIPYISDDDVYRARMSDFLLSDSTKINDDLIGGNEVKPFISNYNDQTYFVSWEDEVKNWAQLISNTGQKLGEPFPVDNKRYEFFSDGKIISYWDKTVARDEIYVGFTIYDQDWNETYSDTLGVIDRYFNDNIIFRKNNDQFIILYRDADKIMAAVLNSNGIVIKEQITPGDNRYHSMQLFIENESDIWIGYGHNLQCFNNQFEETSQLYTIPYYAHYIGNNRYLDVQRYEFPLDNNTYYNFSVFSLSDSLVAKDVYLGYDLSELQVNMLAKNNYVFMGRQGADNMFKIFDINGKQINPEFNFSSDSLSAKKDLTFAENNDQVFFVWADSRNSGFGYDIYGSLYKGDEVITLVEDANDIYYPAEFTLSQNYPNPFNPTTTIEYTIPSNTVISRSEATRNLKGSKISHLTSQVRNDRIRVKLVVYDLLGREVATLVKKQQRPGIYKVEFDASNLASGIYYYQLKFRDYSKTKKMVLLR